MAGANKLVVQYVDFTVGSTRQFKDLERVHTTLQIVVHDEGHLTRTDLCDAPDESRISHHGTGAQYEFGGSRDVCAAVEHGMVVAFKNGTCTVAVIRTHFS